MTAAAMSPGISHQGLLLVVTPSMNAHRLTAHAEPIALKWVESPRGLDIDPCQLAALDVEYQVRAGRHQFLLIFF